MELIGLFVAHHVADVWGQPSWLIEAKRSHLWAIFEHVVIYAGVMSLALAWLDMFETWHFFYFLVGHFAIDSFFYRVLPKLRHEEKQYWYVYPDQALHYLQILAIILYVGGV